MGLPRKIVSMILSIVLLSGISFVFATGYSDEFSAPAYAQALDDYENRASGGEGENTYYHFNPAKIFDTSGHSESDGGIMGGFTGIIDFIITKIFLPLGIVLSTWRVAYLAIFPMIMGLDPLSLMDSPRYKGASGPRNTRAETQGVWEAQAHTFGQSGFGGILGHNYEGTQDPSNPGGDRPSSAPTISQSYEDITAANRYSTVAGNYIKQELKFMLFGLLITFCAWGLVELMMKIAVFALNIADSASTAVVN